MSAQNLNLPLSSLSPAPAFRPGLGAGLLAGLRMRFEAIRRRHAAARAIRRDVRARCQLIELARRYEATQPSFAKDLFAAAASDRRR